MTQMIDERLVVLVRLEALPFGFVGVRQNDAGERNGADVLRPDVVPPGSPSAAGAAS